MPVRIASICVGGQNFGLVEELRMRPHIFLVSSHKHLPVLDLEFKTQNENAGYVLHLLKHNVPKPHCHTTLLSPMHHVFLKWHHSSRAVP